MARVLGVSRVLTVSLGVSLGLSLGGLPLGTEPLLAQIVPDATLGQGRSPSQRGGERSRLTPNVQMRGGLTDRIDGGAIRNTVLFHSFSEFNVDEAQRVYFANPRGIESIFSRVTGSDVSDIMGTLGVDGTADLFLLNPNGIVFGENARLDIAGSFMATTADSFVFGDGQTFSAVDPDAPPLLTMNVTPGLQWGARSAPPGARNASFSSRSTPLSPPLLRGETGSPAPDGQEREGPPLAPSPWQGEGWGGVIPGTIASNGNLSVGESLTLVGDRLHLSGTLTAGRNLNIRSPQSIPIRDTPTEPFIATAGNHLRLRGESIDIFALNHPDSGLTAGGNLVLRSGRPVIGDAQFQAGREFRVERSRGGLGRLISETDPVIRSDGDVSFRNYEGASLHILAGGSVTIPGPITITGADTRDNALRESVTLSDGTTVVEIDGSAEPTLDIRSGIQNLPTPNPSQEGESNIQNSLGSADITLGDITNPGGLVFLSNQYRPNGELSGGDVRVGAIDTSVERFTAGTARGGDVVIDSRGDIEMAGDVTAFARAGDFEINRRGDIRTDNDSNPIIEFAGNNARAVGGDIIVFSGNNITTQNLEAFAIAAAEGEENRTLQADGTELVQSGDARAIARGGAVTLATQVDTNGQPVRASIGNIETAVINTSARTVVDVSADASVQVEVEKGNSTTVVNTINAGVAVAGTANTQARGGPIALETHVTTGNIIAASDVGHIEATTIDSSADASINASADASIDASADASTDFLNSGNGGTATGGTVGDVNSQGGAISLTTHVPTGNILAASDVGHIEATTIDSSAAASVDASADASIDAFVPNNSGDGGTAIGGMVGDINSRGGAIALSSYITTGDIIAESDVGHIETTTIDSSADADIEALALAYVLLFASLPGSNSGDGGTATGGTVGDIKSQGGAIALSSHITTGDIIAESDVGHIETMTIDSSADTDIYASAGAGVLDSSNDGDGDGGTATGGTVGDIESQGGGIVFSPEVITGEIAAESNVGHIVVTTISLFADVEVFANTDADVLTSASFSGPFSASNNGNAGVATGGKVEHIESQGGAIALSTNVIAGNITAESDVGRIEILTINSSTSTSTTASASTGISSSAFSFRDFDFADVFSISNNGNGGTVTGGTLGSISSEGGRITLSTNVSARDIIAESALGRIEIATINSSTDVEASAYTNASSYASATFDAAFSVSNNGNGGTATGGTVGDIKSQGGSIDLTTHVTTGEIVAESDVGRIETAEINLSAEASANSSANATATTTPSGRGSAFAESFSENSGNGGIATGGTTGDVLAIGGSINLNTQVESGQIGQSSNVGPLQVAGNLNTTASSFADTSADASTNASVRIQRGNVAALGLNRGESGQATGGNAIAIATAGEIRLTTNISDGSINPVSGQGRIQVDAPVNTSARALADAIADGNEAQSQVGEARFESNGGNITVESISQIQFSDDSRLNASAGVFSQSNQPDRITENAALNGGNITIEAENNIFLNQISAETNSLFEVRINGEETIINANTLSSSAGAVTIRTPATIRLRDRAGISVSATGGEGTAGDLNFSADSLILGERSRLFSQTESGNGGNINLNLQDTLLMNRGSQISTSAGTAQNGGNGGDINLTLANGYILANTPNSNTDITANAFEGSGGTITITTPGLVPLLLRLLETQPETLESLFQDSPDDRDPVALSQGVFGLNIRSRATLEALRPQDLDPGDLPSNDISAISQNNPELSGAIAFQTPDIDPTQGVFELPVAFTDLPPINPICVAARSGGSFTLTGRGGIPPAPTDLPNQMDPWEDWYIATPEAPSSTHAVPTHHASAREPIERSPEIRQSEGEPRDRPKDGHITEAQGWLLTPEGTIVLAAASRTATPTNGNPTPQGCDHHGIGY